MNKSGRAPLLLPAYPHRNVNMHETLRYDALTSITRASHVGTWRNSVGPCGGSQLLLRNAKFFTLYPRARKKDHIACIFSSPPSFYIGGRYGALSQLPTEMKDNRRSSDCAVPGRWVKRISPAVFSVHRTWIPKPRRKFLRLSLATHKARHSLDQCP